MKNLLIYSAFSYSSFQLNRGLCSKGRDFHNLYSNVMALCPLRSLHKEKKRALCAHCKISLTYLWCTFMYIYTRTHS